MTESAKQQPRVPISKKLVMVNSASSLMTRLLSLSVLVWLQQYLLKRISPDEYQLLPVLYSIMMFAPLLTTVLTGGLARYIIDAYAKDDEERVNQIISTMFPILCVAGALFVAGGWLFAWFIDDILTISPEYVSDARIMLAMLMLCTALRLPLAPFSVGLVVRQMFWVSNVIGIGGEIVRLSVLFTLLFGVSTRVIWVVTAAVCAEMLNMAVILVVSRRVTPFLRYQTSMFRWPIAREIVSFGGWSFSASFAETVRSGADPIILNKLATPTDVACFHLGTLVLRHVHLLVTGMLATMGPALISLHASNDRERLKRIFLRIGRLALWAVLFPVLPLMVYSAQIIEIYAGSRYAEAAPVMVVSLIFFPLFYVFLLVPNLANTGGRIRDWALITMSMNSLNLLLTFFLVGYLDMGAFGSALATILAMAVVYPFAMLPFARSLTGVTLPEWLRETVLFGYLPGISALLVWVPLIPVARRGGGESLFLCVCAGGAVYIVVLCFFALRRKDREDFFSFIRGVLGTRASMLKGGMR